MQEPRVWCIENVSGYVCVVLVYCFLGFGDYVIIAKLIFPVFESSPLGAVLMTSLCVGLCGLATVSHFRCMLSNPVNNCVGARNTKFFLLFLFNVCCTAILAFSLMVTRILKCAQIEWEGNCAQIMNDSMWLGGLFVVSLLFGLFTGGMFIDMIMSIRSNTTAIDKLKHQYGEKRPFCVNLEEVFGEPVSIRWALPCYAVTSEVHPPIVRGSEGGMGADEGVRLMDGGENEASMV